MEIRRNQQLLILPLNQFFKMNNLWTICDLKEPTTIKNVLRFKKMFYEGLVHTVTSTKPPSEILAFHIKRMNSRMPSCYGLQISQEDHV